MVQLRSMDLQVCTPAVGCSGHFWSHHVTSWLHKTAESHAAMAHVWSCIDTTFDGHIDRCLESVTWVEMRDLVGVTPNLFQSMHGSSVVLGAILFSSNLFWLLSFCVCCSHCCLPFLCGTGCHEERLQHVSLCVRSLFCILLSKRCCVSK